MNVGELKKLIRDIPDETMLLISGNDHSYYKSEARYVDVVASGGKKQATYLFEYYGPNYLDEKDEVIKALVIS